MADGMAQVTAEMLLVENERARIDAETAKLRAEEHFARMQAEVFEAEAAMKQIAVAKAWEARQVELSSDWNHHVYRFEKAVSAETVSVCKTILSGWARLDAETRGEDDPCTIELIFMSPGGSVIHGMGLFDFILDLRRAGHRIITKANGYAASMAGILLQAGDERVMGREAWLLIHRGSAGASGDMHQIEDTVEWFKKIDERILNIFYAQHEAHAKTTRSKKWLKEQFERKDWWLSSDDAFKLGFCDRID